jgi:hypothetical protein
MSSAMYDDSVPTPNVYREDVDERGRTIRPVKLQLAKIIMGTPVGHGRPGYDFSLWNGTDPRNIPGRFVFILSKLEDRDIYPYITIGDLVKLQSLDTDNILIPTECLLGRYTGDTTIGTYLHPPSSMSQQPGQINLQQAQTFLPNLMRDGRILMRVFKNPYKNTFWYKFNESESSNIDIKNHLQPLRACLKIPSNIHSNYFIHSTYPWNISDSGYYQPLRKYIPRNPETDLYRHLSVGLQKIRMSGIRTRVREKIYNLKKMPEVIRLKTILEGGKSRRKLKTTNRRTNTRTNRRRNTRINRRRNTKKRRN